MIVPNGWLPLPTKAKASPLAPLPKRQASSSSAGSPPMSAPMPSRKSSVGSKSSTLHPDAGVASAFFPYAYADERGCAALRSSWITRLRLRPRPRPRPRALPLPAPSPPRPCPPPSPSLGRPRTISTDESRTPTPFHSSSFLSRRCLSLLAAHRPPAPSPTPLSRGFGPFQVRTIAHALPWRAEGNLDDASCDRDRVGSFPLFKRTAEDSDGGRKLKTIPGEESWDDGKRFFPNTAAADCRANVRLSPFFQFRPPPPDSGYLINSRSTALVKGKGICCPDPYRASSSRDMSVSKPADNGSQWPRLAATRYVLSQELIDEGPSKRPFEQRLSVNPWIASTPVQHVSVSRGDGYHEGADGITAARDICEPHLWPHSTVPWQSERQTTACLNEPEEPFSYWNMGRFKRKNTVTSVLPVVPLTCNLGRKRNSNADDAIAVKYRKLGSDD